MIILCGIHVKIKLYYFLFYMVFNTTFLVFCNYSKSFIKYNNSRNLILTSTDKSCRITFVVRQAQLAQLVEQRTENPCVSGSIPELGILIYYGILAQLVEHLTFNQVVRGSNPRCLISKRKPSLVRVVVFFFY